ncbi:hypothetical protein [Flavobacterium enshiense]|uniref:Lipocalin-like domain-containing protein n=1 Tax=Flavobacterium enshiense DK69 TaxID=1107311 RepID=A0A0A2MWJ8_9FLAO|nr:hypothetical protein [Flavobacterium enshiense]KGO97072.1 hypothetical protein Q767_00255 [Flavobacterium enshiense DK69]
MKNNTKIKTISFIIMILPLICLAQSDKDYIFGKRWYAIKAFYGAPGEQKTTDFICEESTIIDNHPYLFYIDINSSGSIQTDRQFQFKKPLYCRIENFKLSMYFSYDADDKIQFDIKERTDDLLQLEGPNKEMYFLVSDNKRK